MSRRPWIDRQLRDDRLHQVKTEALHLVRMEYQVKRARDALAKAMLRADKAGVDFASIADVAEVSVSTVKREVKRIRRGR